MVAASADDAGWYLSSRQVDPEVKSWTCSRERANGAGTGPRVRARAMRRPARGIVVAGHLKSKPERSAETPYGQAL